MKEAKAKTSDMMWVKVFGTGSPPFGSFLKNRPSLARFFGVVAERETRGGEVGVDFNSRNVDHSIHPRRIQRRRRTSVYTLPVYLNTREQVE